MVFVEGNCAIDSFYIGKYPVTQGQWKAVMGNNPSYFKKGYDYPVETVSWTEAQEFINLLNDISCRRYRLPMEAEWEYAARGGNKSKGCEYSGSNNINDVAWYYYNIPSNNYGESGYGTQPVGRKAPNELGIYDMSGNVYEWCQDLYEESSRVLRGGSWRYIEDFCRVANRNHFSSVNRNNFVGFRVVC